MGNRSYNKKKNINVNKLRNRLLKYGIQTRPFFWPLHKQPVLKKYNKRIIKLPNSELLSKKGFYLPSGLGLKSNEIKYVCKKLDYVLNQTN